MKQKSKKTRSVEFIVPRESKDENTYATIKAEVDPSASLNLADHFKEALIKAVTQWIRSTDEGKELYFSTSEDLNIGDLASEGISKKLWKELKKVGIFAMSIKTNSICEEHNWNYDAHLFDGGWEECDKCGCRLDHGGFCSDPACPYSDRQQDVTYTEG
ncbi:MAG: hypothetical protein M0R32_02655 [Candidatus Cloacimonetes bacterium]|nr:hypothetical protein [Candidatus Cloacimonadota bacterium]